MENLNLTSSDEKKFVKTCNVFASYFSSRTMPITKADFLAPAINTYSFLHTMNYGVKDFKSNSNKYLVSLALMDTEPLDIDREYSLIANEETLNVIANKSNGKTLDVIWRLLDSIKEKGKDIDVSDTSELKIFHEDTQNNLNTISDEDLEKEYNLGNEVIEEYANKVKM